MTYQETLAYLFNRLPMYQREGKAAYKTDLSNTIKLCDALDNPQKGLKFVHIAGTNGKGSTSHITASILKEAGYKVGLYTSPHLKDFRERIKINGEVISEDYVIDFVANFKDEFENIGLSFFEWTVGLAFSYFKNQNVDIVVLETGLGGRLDSTNIVTPEITAITNIGLDHTQFLGDTIEKIAREKAGIIKRDVPVVIGEYTQITAAVFNKVSRGLNAPIIFSEPTELETDLKGEYQKENLSTAMTIIHQLIEKGWVISNEMMVNGAKSVVKNTGLLGRWQLLCENPRILCDVGHNEDGIKLILKGLEKESYQTLHIVFGTVNDKSVGDIINLLPSSNTEYYLCQANIPRAMEVEDLAMEFSKTKKEYKVVGGVVEALNEAKFCAKENDLIFVGGSTFVVAEVL